MTQPDVKALIEEQLTDAEKPPDLKHLLQTKIEKETTDDAQD